MKSNQNSVTKYCLIAIQRSGSTWLTKLLDSHPSIESLEELFLGRLPKAKLKPNHLGFWEYRQTHKGIRPWILFRYLDDFLDNYPGDYEVIGFKIMYNQLLRNPEVIFKLISDRYKIIHLMRKNYLDVVISQSNLFKHRLAHSDQDVTLDPLYIEPSSLIKKLESIDRKVQIAKYLTTALPLPQKTIIYEELCKNRDSVIADLAGFLEVRSSGIKFESTRKKINKGLYKDKIYNYNEIVTVLSGTRFEDFLKEEE